MRAREAGREREKEISKPLEKGENLIFIVSISLNAMSNLKQKKSQGTERNRKVSPIQREK